MLAAPVALLAFVLLLPLAALARLIGRRNDLVWGPVPIISNRYWSLALREAGWTSYSLMSGFYGINKRADFDLYFDDLMPGWLPPGLRALLAPYRAFIHILLRAKAIHIPFSGGPLGGTRLWRCEAFLLRLAGVKVVVIGYGADTYMYSRVRNPSLTNALLISYPLAARREEEIARRVSYWTRRADIVLPMFMGVDGVGRWDVTTPSPVCIDTSLWTAKRAYSQNDGRNGPVRVVHAPNHPDFKGTEFLVDAVERLRQEGLQVELILLRGVPNDRVRDEMAGADILAEQFIAGMYGLTAIEGMACGLPVMTNLEEDYTRLYRRYAFIDECPILSATPESLAESLKALVTDPGLREQRGRAGRDYVEKYHSYATAQYLFGAIYQKLFDGADVDLMNLFHPLKSPYARAQRASSRGRSC